MRTTSEFVHGLNCTLGLALYLIWYNISSSYCYSELCSRMSMSALFHFMTDRVRSQTHEEQSCIWAQDKSTFTTIFRDHSRLKPNESANTRPWTFRRPSWHNHKHQLRDQPVSAQPQMPHIILTHPVLRGHNNTDMSQEQLTPQILPAFAPHATYPSPNTKYIIHLRISASSFTAYNQSIKQPRRFGTPVL